MRNKVALVLLAIVLVASLVGFGACVTPTEKPVPPEEEKTPPEEEKAPPGEDETDEELRTRAKGALGGFCPVIVDLDASPEGPDSVCLTLTSTLSDKAKSGTYDIRCSTEPITEANCLKLPPVLPQTSKGEPVPGADIYIEQCCDDEPTIEATETEGAQVKYHVRGLESGTTYYFVAWIINEPLESYDYDKEDDGDYKFADFELTDDDYCQYMSNIASCTTPFEEEAVIEVAFRDVEAEPSVILELKKGDNVVLKVMETLLVEPTLTFYTAIWTPDLGQYYWYGYAEWHKELPQYTFGFAMTAAAAPDIGNHNTSRSNKMGIVIVPPDGDNIEWTDKSDYLRLMNKLCGAMEEIGSYEDIIKLLNSELPGSASELIAKQERILDKVSSSDYDEALAQMAKNLPYQGTEIRNPGDVTYEELERVVQAIEASVIVIGLAADLACPNPLAGACFATGNKGGFAIGGFNAA